ncbi:DNA methyltransferase 1-associated protein 1, partial [Ancylostoma duodenale]
LQCVQVLTLSICFQDPNCEPICFDADHERRRKEQLNKQWNRTKEQLEEEEMLLAELKRIEVRKREREKKAQDLQKLINMAEAPASPSVSGACMSPALGKKKGTLRQKAGSAAVATTTNLSFNPVDISVSAIRFPEFKSAGAHLRSQEMKLPTNIGQKKLKNIEVVLSKCKLVVADMNPMGTEAIVAAYNEFRSQIVLLQELKSTLQTAEFELETLRNRLTEEGKEVQKPNPFEIEPRMRISNVSEGGLDPEEVTGEEGAPTTTRRITSFIDTSTTANPLLASFFLKRFFC